MHIGEWKTLSNKVSAMSDDVTSVQIVYMLQCIKHYLSLAFSIFSFWESLFWKVEKKTYFKASERKSTFHKKKSFSLNQRHVRLVVTTVYKDTAWKEKKTKWETDILSFELSYFCLCIVSWYCIWNIYLPSFKTEFYKKKMISPYFVLCTALNTGFRKELIHKDDGGPTTWWDIF